MGAVGKFEFAYLAFLSKPASDRPLYRQAKKSRILNIVELGLGSLETATRLVRLCQSVSGGEPVSYTALDWFEERPSRLPALSLIEAHRSLKATAADVRLMPGGPTAGLPAIANSLMGTDLLLISADAYLSSGDVSWNYAPRMCTPETTILHQPGGQGQPWKPLQLADIERLAVSSQSRAA